MKCPYQLILEAKVILAFNAGILMASSLSFDF